MTERWQWPPKRLILQFSGLRNALFYKFWSFGTRYFTSSVGQGVCFLGWADGVPGEAYPRKSVVQAHSYPRKSVVDGRFHRAVCVAATPCSRSHSLLLEQGYAKQEWMENVPLVAIDAFFDQK